MSTPEPPAIPPPAPPPPLPPSPESGPGRARLVAIVWLLLSVALVGILIAAGTRQFEERGLVVSPGPSGAEPPQALPSPPGAQWKFLFEGPDDDPVRWDPCTPIHYETDLALAPEGAIEEIHEAIRRTEEATGLRFVYDGSRPHDQLDRAIDADLADIGPDGRPRFEPVLIAWVDDDELEEFVGDVEPLTIGYTQVFAKRGVYLTGTIEMLADEAQLRGFGLFGFGPAVQHELGHLVGLDHVDSLGELMNSSPLMRDWGPGDRVGLGMLGSGKGCLDRPKPLA